MPAYSLSTVPNFNSSQSALSALQNGTFGLKNESGTVVNGFYESTRTQVSNRVDALVGMQQTGLPLLPSESDFSQLQESATLNASMYVEGGQQLQTNREVELDWLHKLVLPIFITTVVIYSLSVICIIFSFIIILCILKTQERKYKNVAHISWVSAFVMMIVGSLSACFFTLASLLFE